jgi:2-oxoglutarate dehydrogenase complex dehydrogenase (E1) component-like enzyme
MIRRIAGLGRPLGYAQSMHRAWLKNPKSVGQSWADLFASTPGNQPDAGTDRLVVTAYHLVNCYKIRGHELATIDALSLQNYREYGRKSHA